MQDIVFYVAAGDALGICKDSYGNQTVSAPSIIRGGEVRLRMRLLAGDGTDTQLPVDPLLECVSWEWVMDSDWDDSTPSKLIADNASITVSDVTEGDGEAAKHYTEVVIPIPEMNTQELKDYLASKETATLNGELCGYGEDAKVLFILQVKGFTVRNRIAPSAPPTELADQFLDEAGVRALIETIGKGPQGEKGDPGPANVLSIGTVTTGEPGTQAAASITGESPNQVLNLTIPRGDKGEDGSSGSGSGDMLKSVYDKDGDGKVDAADEADDALNIGGKTAAQVATAVDNSHTHSNKDTLDKLGESDGTLTFDGSPISGGGGTADSVAWDDVTGKPSAFPPSTHSHEISDVTGLQTALDSKGTVKSVNGVEPDSSGNVTIEAGGGGGGTVDESRLLPENPENGDVALFDAVTVGGGNDENTKILLHFDESPFADEAAGNDTPAVVTINGATIDTENKKFGNASVKFAGGTNEVRVSAPPLLMTGYPWMIDCWFKVDSGKWDGYQRIFTQDNEQDGGWSYYLMSGNRVGIFVRNVSGEPVSPALNPDNWHYAALVCYNQKLYAFVDGVRFAIENCSTDSFLDYIVLGKRISYSRTYSLRGNIDEFRLQILDEETIAGWTGTTIPIPDAPYSVAQTTGAWQNQNLNESIDAKISTHNADSAAHPDKVSASDLSSAGIYQELAQLSTDVDFDDLKTQGNYWIPGGYHPNSPVGSSSMCDGFLYVHATSTKVSQIFHNTNDSNLWIRYYYTSRWVDWRRCNGAPDYSLPTDITAAYTSGSNSYTFTSWGWVYAVTGTGGSYAIGNATVASAASGTTASCFVPVKPGDIITGSAAGTLIFYN